MHRTVPAFENPLRALGTPLTHHAAKRMKSRALPATAVASVIRYGRIVKIRGAEIHAIGRREVAHFAREGIDLSAWAGVQVVCTTDGVIVTVYRNHDFRGLRPRRPRRRDRGTTK